MLKKLCSIAVAALSLVALSPAYSQAYPNKPIRWLIPFSAGGPTDALARAIAPKLSQSISAPIGTSGRLSSISRQRQGGVCCWIWPGPWTCSSTTSGRKRWGGWD